jgi:tetratricopeptide (TPR) repeat protein
MRHCLILLLFLFTQPLFGQEVGVQFEQANQFYRTGEYQKAAQLYEQVMKNGYENPALYYNLGNAYFKINNIPAAILSYERARRLAPGDDDISYNLRLANLRLVDKIEPVPQLIFIRWKNTIIQSFSADGWAVFGIVCVWGALCAGLCFFAFRSLLVQRLALLAVAVTFALMMFGFFGMYQQYQYEQSAAGAIIFSPTVSVKSAPDEKSTDLFVIHEGVKVELLDSVGDWRKIRLADGKVGWISNQTIQII